MAGGEVGFLEPVAVYLGAAVIAVPLFKRLGLGSVLGYLAAGVAIGPGALALIENEMDALRVAEFGVVLLLFVIGLELKPARLWRLRMAVFGLGAAQVLSTAAVIGLAAGLSAAWGFGLDPAAATIAGFGLALSSTAFAIQIMRERNALKTPYGDRAFAILLFQDLAIVPLIALVGILAPVDASAAADPTWWAALKAMAAIALVYFPGRYLLGPMFHLIAESRAEEVFTAAALLVVIGSALIMQAAGLSMAMGAFLAGVLLAESAFRHQLEVDIEPFRGLLMGLFFIAVGMNLDLRVVAENTLVIVACGVALIVLKAVILYGLSRLAGARDADAIRIAAVLSQGGEFAFVLFSEALSQGVMPVHVVSLLNAIVTVSMALTPIALIVADRLAARHAHFGHDGPDAAEAYIAAADVDGRELPASADLRPILVAGFGRSGQVVARILRLRGYETILIDNNPRRIRIAETFFKAEGADDHVFYGDARRLETLRVAGAAGARALFLCVNDRDGMAAAVGEIRREFPQLEIFAATYDRFSMMELEKAGAHHVERETFESTIQLVRRGLEALGDGEIAEDLIEEFRARDAVLLKLQSEYGALDGVKKLREGYSLQHEP